MRAKEFIFEAPSRFQPQQRSTLDNERLDQLRKDPNVRIMLDLISRAEGNTDYNTIVGGGKFKDFSTHPNKTVYLKSLGNTIQTNAAGKYQIMGFNWGPYSKRLNLKDFSPESQDKIAIQMIADRGALNSVLKGDYVNGIKKLKSQWASLPATEIKQGYGPKSWKWVNDNVAELKTQYELDKTKDTQVAKKEPSTLDKIKNVASNILGPTISSGPATAKDTPVATKSKPGYYAVGDSHAQGVGGYSNDPKNNIAWNNLGAKGASAFDKRHLQNIKNIPPGSVVALSLGANDLGSKKLSDIIDQVNKTIAASKAQGHQVVYMLPTASSNPKLQQKREELRQALLKSLDSRDILDLGTAPSSKEVRGGDDVHLAPQGYQKYGGYISQMFKPGVTPQKPPKTQAEPTTTAPPAKITSEPPAAKTTKTEPNIVQQYVDANKPQQPVKQKPELTVGTPEYDARMEKIQTAAGDKFSQERQARLNQPISAPKTSPEVDPKAWQDYDKRMEKLQTAAGDKFSKEYQATEKIPPEDDSYFTKIKNLFK
jgi:muramidase (phage lysozyme)